MKKLISLLLVLVMVLSLGACGKKTNITSLLECPTGSLEEAEAFLKKAGLEIKNTSADYVTFTFGNWDGQVSALGISLSIREIAYGDQKVDYDKETKDMVEQVEDLCGEPYNTNESNGAMGMDMQSSMSFYKYDGGTIVVNESTIAGTSSMNILIYPGANT